MRTKSLKIGSLEVGARKPVFILGPCVIESEKFLWRMARKIAGIARDENVPLIFTASCDKANRTSVRSFRGIEVRESIGLFAAIGAEMKVSVATDVFSPAGTELAAKFT